MIDIDRKPLLIRADSVKKTTDTHHNNTQQKTQTTSLEASKV